MQGIKQSLSDIPLQLNGCFWLPQRPAYRNDHLDSSRDPEIRRQTSRTSTDPAPNDPSNQNGYHSSASPIPLHIFLCQHMRITCDIAVNTRQDCGRHFIEPKQTACNNLPTTLKCEECQRYKFEEIYVGSAFNLQAFGRWNHIRLHQSSRDDYARTL